MELKDFKNIVFGELDGFTTKTIHIKNNTITYRTNNVIGVADRTIIFSHGIGDYSKYMNMLIYKFMVANPNTKIISIDLPNHGDSISDTKITNIDTLTSIIEDMLHEFRNIGELKGLISWVGHNLGGNIGINLAIRKRVPIFELTLLNSSYNWGDNLSNIFSHNFADKVEGYKKFLHKTTKDMGNLSDIIVENIDIMLPTIEQLNEDLMVAESVDFEKDLNKVLSKTLIISGTQDSLSNVKMQENLLSKIPNSQMLILSDDHYMVLKPYAVDVIVGEFNRFFKK